MIHYYYDLAGTGLCGKREALRWGFGRLGTGGQSNAVLTVAIQQSSNVEGPNGMVALGWQERHQWEATGGQLLAGFATFAKVGSKVEAQKPGCGSNPTKVPRHCNQVCRLAACHWLGR